MPQLAPRLAQLPTVVVGRPTGSRPDLGEFRAITGSQLDQDPTAAKVLDDVKGTFQHWHDRYGWTPRADGSEGLRVVVDAEEPVTYFLPQRADGWHMLILGKGGKLPGFPIELPSQAGRPATTRHELAHYLQVNENPEWNSFPGEWGRAAQEGTADALAFPQEGRYVASSGATDARGAQVLIRSYEDPPTGTVIFPSLRHVDEVREDSEPHAMAGLLASPLARYGERSAIGVEGVEELVFRTVTSGELPSFDVRHVAAGLLKQAESLHGASNQHKLASEFNEVGISRQWLDTGSKS